MASDPIYQRGDVIVAHSLEEAIEIAKQQPGADEIHIGGGAELYKQAFPMIDKLYLTIVDAEAEADAFFPEYADQFTKKVFEERREWNGMKYKFVDLERA